MLLSLTGAVSQGILWGIMVLGVFITFRMLDIADLTVSVLLGMLAGLVAGAVTGLLHTLFDIPAILAGILTQISLWSVNLRVMGKSNTPLLGVDTVFSRVATLLGVSNNVATLVIGALVAALCVALLYWFFGTEIGSAMRATGQNEDMCRALGIDVRVTKLLALSLSNGLVGLSGALVCQSQKYADINMGTGAIVIGLAAIVIGEVLGRLTPGKLQAFGSRLTSAVVGSVIYFIIRAIVLQMGMDANDMKLFSAVIVALALVVPVVLERSQARRAWRKGGER